MAHLGSGDAGRHQHYERLPASSEVPGGSLDVGQRSDRGFHQERGRHTIVHTDADDDTPAQVVRSQGDHVGSHPSARSAQHPSGFAVQSRPDTEHQVDDGHGASTTRVCQVGRATGRLVCDIRQQTTHQVCITISGPQGRVDGCHVGAPGQREGPPVCVAPIQDGPSSSAEDRSVTRPQGDSDRSTATWFPELMDLAQEDPIPLFVEGQDLLTQDVLIGDGVTETRHYRPSNLHAWKLYGPS